MKPAQALPGALGEGADHVARWALLVVLAAAGFWRTWARIAGEVTAGSGSEVFLAAPVGAVLTAVALHLRRRPELPIHDRQSDKIAGTIVLAIALMIEWLVLPRYTETYVLLHLDFIAAWMFLLGGSVFFFGTRRTFRYWPSWLLLTVATPGALRLAVFALGGGWGAEAVVMVLVVSVGPLAILGPPALRRLRGAGAAEDRRSGGSPLPSLVVSPREAWRSAPLVIVVAVLLSLAPLPAGIDERLSPGPGALNGAGQILPAGWEEVDRIDYPWAERMFGPSATLERQMIRATRVRADWDELLRPRVAAVQTLTVGDPGVLEVFPLEMMFDLSSARISPPRPVPLNRGVSARYRTVIDDENLLTWSVMSFVWTRAGDRIQRVTLITVDNHEFDAEFPPAVPGSRSFSRLLSLALRGAGAVTDTNSQEKDLDMLTELATDLVEAQWTDG
ncbi:MULTISPECIES: hypothetical protein [unclassified Dietzia]|uniref:hypothetical protein n=1 Tax=unclassified Dietzia TaxID=2617939 RepID=UPI0015F9CBD2|nr:MULTISPECIES: hypothetical protein [unclassified Dietzia]MBB1026086.1 hypothetical protein [Dietzia sp. DQ12-76]MBB1029260.1 hypothetical protein [Dietzia sp. DQ11-38-2]